MDNVATVSTINTIPAQYTIFKGKTAARFQLQKPERQEDRFKTGSVSMQIAPFKEARQKSTTGKTRKFLAN